MTQHAAQQLLFEDDPEHDVAVAVLGTTSVSNPTHTPELIVVTTTMPAVESAIEPAADTLDPEEFSLAESALLLGAFVTLALSILAFGTL
jgi:hypothetical protein